MLLNALAGDPPVLLFDLPGGVVGELGKVLDEGDSPHGLFDEYRDRGYAITIVVVMTPVKASVRTVQHSIESFGDAVDYLVVKNLAYGAPDAFINFDGCDQDGVRLPVSVGKRFLLDQGGLILEMPALDPRSYAWLDVDDLGFTEAIAAQPSPLRSGGRRLPVADQTRIKKWFLDFDRMLAPPPGLFWDFSRPRRLRLPPKRLRLPPRPLPPRRPRLRFRQPQRPPRRLRLPPKRFRLPPRPLPPRRLRLRFLNREGAAHAETI